MSETTGRRSAWITLSAVISFLGSVVAIGMGGLIVFGSILSRNRQFPASQTATPMSPFAAAVMLDFISAIYIAFGAWGIVSVVGLLRRRNWARQCFVAFGVILAFFSLSGAFGSIVGMLFGLPSIPPESNISPELMTGAFLFIAALALLGFGLGIWWVVYFLRPAIRAQFGPQQPPAFAPLLPLSIRIISWLLIVTGSMIPLQFLLSFPVFIAGFVIRGVAARIVMSLLSVTCLASGIGMLRKQRWAHSLAIGYFGFGLFNSMGMLVPGAMTRIRTVMYQVQAGNGFPPEIPEAFLWFGLIIGFLFTGVILWLLITRRRAFAASEASSAWS